MSAHADAFAGHYGFERLDYETWRRRRMEIERFDASLWFIARDTAGIAGYVFCSIIGEGGFVETLGVVPRARRQGLGSALLRHAFRELAQRREEFVALGVDAENPTGATELYERAGMRTLWRTDWYEKQLASERGG